MLTLVVIAAGSAAIVVRGPEVVENLVAELRPPTASPGLAFKMPSTKVLRASSRKVFAHYIPSLPTSLDNAPASSDYYSREYLQPDGEDGQHAAYGGFLRDRPMSRPPRPSPGWKLADFDDEVRQAVAAGIDGFSVDLLEMPGGSDPRVAENVSLLMQSAHDTDPGFDIMLMPDMSGSLSQASAGELADYVADLGQRPSAYRLADGRLVVAPFHAETHDSAWWKDFIDVMRTQHGISVALLPVFLDERGLAQQYASFAYGMSNWGSRNPDENDPAALTPDSQRLRADDVLSRNLVWMQPVSWQDERPRSGEYQEADGTLNLRDTWRLAIGEGAQIVQLTTWNDYAEGTAFAPSERNNWAPLDISDYYLTWFKTGRRPTLLRDVVYLTHRIQPYAAQPRYPETELMKLQGATPAVDRVEALAMLTKPAQVRVTVGGHTTTCSLPAGVNTCTADLQPGTVSAEIVRGDDRKAKVVSPYPVTTQPYVQDLSYICTSSTGRRGRVP